MRGLYLFLLRGPFLFLLTKLILGRFEYNHRPFVGGIV